MIDRPTFERAYRTYAPALAGMTGKITHGSADSEDVAQDAWAEAWKAREQLNMPGLWGWLCRVARRIWWRRVNLMRGRHVEPEFTHEIEERAIEPEQHDNAQIAQIEHATETMGAGQRESVRLALRGHDAGDIARIRGVSLSAATGALRIAVQRLRQKWGLT